MVTPHTLEKIEQEIILSGRDDRYSLEGYSFVLEGLNFYSVKTGEKRHYTGRELATGLLDYAQKQYGPLAGDVLQSWGIEATNDFGYIVYNLIDIKLLSKSANDRLDDFFNIVPVTDYLGSKENYRIDKTFIKSLKGS